MRKKKPTSKSSVRKSPGSSSRSASSRRSSNGRSTSQGHSGHGGWFGDSESHAEAARYGRAHEGSRSSRYEDEGDGYGLSSRGSSGRSSGRGHDVWLGDTEGHHEAARYGHVHPGARSTRYEDEDYSRSGRSSGRGYGGHGGWYGDSEGHSEAARQNRGGRSAQSRNYEDEGYGSRHRSSSRYGEDEDEGYGRGKSGWFGNSEGPSQVARRR